MITLYKSARKSDKHQEWSIEVEGDKYRMTSGFVGGKSHTSEWTTCKGKNIGKANETSPEDQARLEAEAKVTKKRKEGYYDSIDESAAGLTFFEPMLAKQYLDRLHLKKDGVTFPAVAQTKFNGGRCIATKDGLFTRKGEPWLTCPHISEVLKPFFDKNPDAIIDGELFNHELRERLNAIMELIRKTVNITDEVLAQTKELVKFYVYDGFGYKADAGDEPIIIQKEDGYMTRSLGLALEFSEIHPCIVPIDHTLVNSHEEVEEFYREQLADRHEGVIIRLLDKPYQQGRSAWLLKMKPTDSDEAKILRVNEGDGNRSGQAATVTLETDDGRVFDATVGGTLAQRKAILENQADYVGKQTTYFFNGLTGKGIPNFAQFDPDNSMGGAVDK